MKIVQQIYVNSLLKSSLLQKEIVYYSNLLIDLNIKLQHLPCRVLGSKFGSLFNTVTTYDDL